MTQTNGGVDPEAWNELKRAAARANLNTVTFRGWERDEIKLFLQTIGRFVFAQTRPLQKQVDELKAQIEELERHGVRYEGIYQRAQNYRRGAMTTYDGNVWACIEDTEPNEAPGTSSKWQLAVKAGRDGNRQPTKGGARPETIVQRRT